MPARASHKTLFSALLQTQHFLQSLKVTGGLRRIPFARSAYAYLYQHWVPRDEFSVESLGDRLLLDPEDMGMSRALLLSRGEWELAETQIFRSFVRQGMTVVDIGANIGYYSLIAARLVGPTGKVFAFEPSPRNVTFLKRNIAANGYRNITVIPKAVTDYSGITQFDIDPASSGTHRISPSKGRSNSILAETISLDDYFTGHAARDTRVDFIKMDAEGAEPAILAGMRQLLERNPKVELLTEFSPAAIRMFGASPELFLRDLRDQGFAIYPVSNSGAAALALEPGENASFVASFASVNLLCLRGQGQPPQGTRAS